jgi:hypothetical protein
MVETLLRGDGKQGENNGYRLGIDRQRIKNTIDTAQGVWMRRAR